MFRISSAIISKLQPARRARTIIWDEELRGFGVSVYPSGRKTFIVRYKDRTGTRKTETVGNCSVWSVSDARARARETIYQAQSLIPLAPKDMTFLELTRDYLSLYARPHKKTWKKDESHITRFLLPAWKQMRLSDITPLEVTKLFRKLSTHPTQANRVLELVRSMFNQAIQWERYSGKNPASGIRANREVSRDRFLQPYEVERLLNAIASDESYYARAAILLLIFTGRRPSEILNAEWSDVDFDRRALRARDTKNGSTHYVPLSEPAFNLLRNLQPDGSRWVIPGRIRGQKMVNLHKPWCRIKTRAGIPDLQMRDLRRTVGSWLGDVGTPEHLIREVLNHKSRDMSRVYVRARADASRDALEQYARRLLECGKM